MKAFQDREGQFTGDDFALKQHLGASGHGALYMLAESKKPGKTDLTNIQPLPPPVSSRRMEVCRP
jgi:hypothetical protein